MFTGSGDRSQVCSILRGPRPRLLGKRNATSSHQRLSESRVLFGTRFAVRGGTGIRIRCHRKPQTGASTVGGTRRSGSRAICIALCLCSGLHRDGEKRSGIRVARQSLRGAGERIALLEDKSDAGHPAFRLPVLHSSSTHASTIVNVVLVMGCSAQGTWTVARWALRNKPSARHQQPEQLSQELSSYSSWEKVAANLLCFNPCCAALSCCWIARQRPISDTVEHLSPTA